MTDSIIRLRTLASGSSGNATFLRFGDTRLLVDAGIAYPRIRRGLESMGEQVDALSGLLLTHEHGDHVSGLEAMLESHPTLPVYATAGTAAALGAMLDTAHLHTIEAGQAFSPGTVEVRPFRTSHDARESVGYRFERPGFALGYATDLGTSSRDVVSALKGCQVVVLEANYDVELLQWSRYPAFLKRRIAGRGGHLSNEQAARLLEAIAHPGLEQVVLVHLSEQNNTPDKALAAATAALARRKGVCVLTAPRHEPGPALSFRACAPDPAPEQLKLI